MKTNTLPRFASALSRFKLLAFALCALAFVPLASAATIIQKLVDFDGTNGASPRGSLIQGDDGYFYGLTGVGGVANKGVAFKMTPTGVLTKLAEFDGANNGDEPDKSLVRGNDGNFYGVCSGGGANNFGTAFMLTPAGVLTKIADFTGGANGAYPQDSLVLGTNGNFYGLTFGGGVVDSGTTFKLTSAGLLTKLGDFDDVNGKNTTGGLIQGNDGYFYGLTQSGGNGFVGTVFSMTYAGGIKKIADFDDGTTGGVPEGNLIQGDDGDFYGLTQSGGANNNGTAFRVTAAGVLTKLVDFGGNVGGKPNGSLVQGRNGILYGLTLVGGAHGIGTVFKMTPAGLISKMADFSAADGASPEGSLVLGNDGNFYGMTRNGGAYNKGIVFRLYEGDAIIKNDDAPDMNGGKFVALGNPAMNDKEHVAFQAKVAGGGANPTNNSGIWADDTNGVRHLVVRTGDAAADTSGAVFSTLGDPVYNGNEAIAFIGKLTVGVGDATVANNIGVWINDSGTHHLVARKSFDAPGCTTGTTFLSFTSIALPDVGGVVMLAKLGGTATASNALGIWVGKTGGTLKLILRKGDTHPANGKIITGLSFMPSVSGVAGQTRSFSQSTGNLLYKATFADGSFGIFKVVFP